MFMMIKTIEEPRRRHRGSNAVGTLKITVSNNNTRPALALHTYPESTCGATCSWALKQLHLKLMQPDQILCFREFMEEILHNLSPATGTILFDTCKAAT